MKLDVDIPSVVTELDDCYQRYEVALVAGDLEAMGDLFWSDQRVTRFGAADYQVGAEELAAYRAARGPLGGARHLEDTRITTFGTDVGVVTTLFRTSDDGRLGRQSQTWVKLHGRWRVVHAHVSRIEEQ